MSIYLLGVFQEAARQKIEQGVPVPEVHQMVVAWLKLSI